MSKSPQAFRTIGEVAKWLGVAPHVLRFWESRFSQIKPVKRAGGRRYYRPGDMELLGGIKVLLYDQGVTIRGVQKIIRDKGVAHITGMSPPMKGMPPMAERIIIPKPDPELPPALTAARSAELMDRLRELVDAAAALPPERRAALAPMLARLGALHGRMTVD
ncbi:MAG: MerR family transcriptional regulator [Rhodobacteraceae bacterium]|nr:MerR family transcriptional regulator [Paracoccaceae bacterium]